jgi:hypothetical protein
LLRATFFCCEAQTKSPNLIICVSEAFNLAFSLTQWIFRNFNLLIGGLILLPLTLFIAALTLGLGVGFSSNPLAEALKIIAIAVSYLLVFIFSLHFSLKRYRIFGDYGMWDLLPILYFTSGCFILLVLSGSQKLAV